MTFRDTIEKYYLSEDDAEKEKVIMELYSYTGVSTFNDLTYYNVRNVEYSENHVFFTYKGRKYVFSGSFMIYEEERR